jgi:putative colanic acid biosynthesis acetyltransferase WcaF
MDREGIFMMLEKEFENMIKEIVYYPHGVKGELIVVKSDDGLKYRCLLSRGVILDLTGNMYIGIETYIACGAQIWTHTHDLKGAEILLEKQKRIGEAFNIPKDKVIMDDVWIYSSIILPGCRTIATGVVIGAGAVVAKSILEPWSIWGGNPAQRIGSRLDGSVIHKRSEENWAKAKLVDKELKDGIEFNNLKMIREESEVEHA